MKSREKYRTFGISWMRIVFFLHIVDNLILPVIRIISFKRTQRNSVEQQANDKWLHFLLIQTELKKQTTILQKCVHCAFVKVWNKLVKANNKSKNIGTNGKKNRQKKICLCSNFPPFELLTHYKSHGVYVPNTYSMFYMLIIRCSNSHVPFLREIINSL